MSKSDAVHIARSKALEQYSALEHALLMLFAALLETRPELAAQVFYRLGAAGRNRMFEALLHRKFDDKYDAYWYGTSDNRDTGLMRMIRSLDDRRHQFAHWKLSAFVYPEGQKERDGVYLVKPEHGFSAAEPHQVSKEHMEEFVERAHFVTVNVINFAGLAAGSPYVGADRGRRDTWLEIFSRPILYPPPQGHPLAPQT